MEKNLKIRPENGEINWPEEKLYIIWGILNWVLILNLLLTAEEDPTNKLFMRVFLTRGMSKHSYSDQTFYDENDEIFAPVYPRVNRIAIWTGNVSTIFRPPSMGHEGDEHSLFVKLTSDLELFKEAFEIYSVKLRFHFLIFVIYFLRNCFLSKFDCFPYHDSRSRGCEQNYTRKYKNSIKIIN